MAARDGHVEIVTVLLASGADPNLEIKVGTMSHIFVYNVY